MYALSKRKKSRSGRGDFLPNKIWPVSREDVFSLVKYEAFSLHLCDYKFSHKGTKSIKVYSSLLHLFASPAKQDVAGKPLRRLPFRAYKRTGFLYQFSVTDST